MHLTDQGKSPSEEFLSHLRNQLDLRRSRLRAAWFFSRTVQVAREKSRRVGKWNLLCYFRDLLACLFFFATEREANMIVEYYFLCYSTSPIWLLEAELCKRPIKKVCGIVSWISDAMPSSYTPLSKWNRLFPRRIRYETDLSWFEPWSAILMIFRQSRVVEYY